ncbi:MAG TPA: hypothetical protein VFQ61_31545, partial [Polyangiaceae bacterium]|nr:hypothetical protein [Polyangiaceae bacterium]
MRWRHAGTCMVLAGAMGLTVAASATNPDDAFEQRIAGELSAIDPSLVETFARANAARDKGDHRTAERLYAEVFEKAPGWYHAERRRCGELVALERRDEALPLCRHAAEKEPSSANLVGLASAILHTPRGKQLYESEKDEAVELLRRAEALDPTDSQIALVQCEAALARANLGELRDCRSRLERIA